MPAAVGSRPIQTCTPRCSTPSRSLSRPASSASTPPSECTPLVYGPLPVLLSKRVVRGCTWAVRVSPRKASVRRHQLIKARARRDALMQTYEPSLFFFPALSNMLSMSCIAASVLNEPDYPAGTGAILLCGPGFCFANSPAKEAFLTTSLTSLWPPPPTAPWCGFCLSPSPTPTSCMSQLISIRP